MGKNYIHSVPGLFITVLFLFLAINQVHAQPCAPPVTQVVLLINQVIIMHIETACSTYEY
jgi:hypothetical protein